MPTMGRILLALNLLWTSFTVVALGFITAMILRDPAFPLGLGWIRTRGPAGLWITLPLLSLALGGLVLQAVRHPLGIRLLLGYSALWTVILVPAVAAELPTIVRHPLAYCANGTCTPWVVTVGITVLFGWSTIDYAIRTCSANFPAARVTS